MENQETAVVNECSLAEDICCICMETVNTAKTGHITSKCCKHLLHIKCFISYTLKNAHVANKCPMCRYDMNTGQPFHANEYDNDITTYYDLGYESEDENEYYYESTDENEPYDNGNSTYYDSGDEDEPYEINTLAAQPRYRRTEEEIKAYCASPYVSKITTAPVSLSVLTNSSQTGIAYYNSDKYECLAMYNTYTCAMDINYQAKELQNSRVNYRKIVSGDVPRCVSIQTTPKGSLYVLIVCPDDGERNKMIIYFPHCETVIMSSFIDTSSLDMHNLENLQITGFSDSKLNSSFIYVNDCESSEGSLLAEVIEYQKLKNIFSS